MVNYKLRFLDMMPVAWFYKLEDMGRARSKAVKKKQAMSTPGPHPSKPPKPPKLSQPHRMFLSRSRKSYYFTRERPPSPSPSSHTPRKSSQQRKPKAACSFLASLEPPPTPSSSQIHDSELNETQAPLHEFRSDNVLPTRFPDDILSSLSSSNSCHCRVVISPSDKDIATNLEKNHPSSRADNPNRGYDHLSDFHLPPIITKRPAKKESKFKTENRGTLEQENGKGQVVKEQSLSLRENKNTRFRKYSVNSPGVKLRTNSPKVATKKIRGHARKINSTSSSSGRRTLSESFAIVKSSSDPQRDFRESMVEMITECDIKEAKGLEDLLACYLSLNTDEYQELIIKVFEQVWFDVADNRLN